MGSRHGADWLYAVGKQESTAQIYEEYYVVASSTFASTTPAASFASETRLEVVSTVVLMASSAATSSAGASPDGGRFAICSFNRSVSVPILTITALVSAMI